MVVTSTGQSLSFIDLFINAIGLNSYNSQKDCKAIKHLDFLSDEMVFIKHFYTSQ